MLDLTPLDIDLVLEDALRAGEISLDKVKDRVALLVPDEDVETWHNPELADKLLRTIQNYVANEKNITQGRMNGLIKDPMSQRGYLVHEYIMSLRYLIDSGQVVEEIVSVPKSGKRPYHKFVFLCLPENDNQEWNAKAVNKWIADFEKVK